MLFPQVLAGCRVGEASNPARLFVFVPDTKRAKVGVDVWEARLYREKASEPASCLRTESSRRLSLLSVASRLCVVPACFVSLEERSMSWERVFGRRRTEVR